MTAPHLYITFPGTAREALGFYAQIFGGELSLHSFEEFNRTDGPSDAIAHGVLSGAVSLLGSDTAGGEPTVKIQGAMLSLLGLPILKFFTIGSTNSRTVAESWTHWRRSRGVHQMVK